MKIRILGTAAAEGIPGMFCACDTCQRSRAAGGRNLRTRSQAVIDDKLLIDFGLDTCAELAAHLKAIGVIDNETQIYMHHFSHNGGATHDEFVRIAREHGFGVTYDGMEIEI